MKKSASAEKFFHLQTTNYNCGSTALASVMKNLGLNPELDAKDVEEICGTNAVIGTTSEHLSRGAENIGLSTIGAENFGWKNPYFPDASIQELATKPRSLAPEDSIDTAIRFLERNYLLLRLDYRVRHWIVAKSYDREKEEFEIFDPSIGDVVYSKTELNEIWSNKARRQFFCFSKTPEHHPAFKKPVAKSNVKNVLAYEKFDISKVSLEEFVGLSHRKKKPTVIAESQFGNFEKMAIQAVKKMIGDQNVIANMRRIPFDHPEIDFFAERGFDTVNNMIVRSKKTREIVGGIYKGTTYIDPKFRGKGYGSAMVRAAYSTPGLVFLYPSHFSEHGYKARVDAWVQMRKEAGLDASVDPDLEPKFKARVEQAQTPAATPGWRM